MNQNNRNAEEVEIDPSQYIKMIVKRKKTFITVFLLIFVIGSIYVLFTPRIYKILMLIQPPVIGPSLTGANDFESAENLKGLIVNSVFNEELRGKFDLESSNDKLEFKVEIPSKTNILQVSINLEEKKKELGVNLLQSLSKSITNMFAKSIEARVAEVSNKIKINDRGIINAKEKAKNLQQQIKEITVREEKIMEELKTVNLYTTQIWDKRDLYFKDSTTSGNSPALFLASFLQNNTSYLNQLNTLASNLSIRRSNLDLDLINIDSQINTFQMEIDKLSSEKDFISNLRVVAHPRVSFNPIDSGKKITLVLSIAIGLFLGVFAVFLQEFWVNNLVKK